MVGCYKGTSSRDQEKAGGIFAGNLCFSRSCVLEQTRGGNVVRSKRAKVRWIALVVVVLSASGFYWQSARGRAPEQPIAFSHQLHAGELQISCLFCHDSARRSQVAGVPSMQRCMGCHSLLEADSPEIKKLKAGWEEKKPVEWVRVHKLPEFTRFNHKRHVSAGVSCQTCHGPVEGMPVVQQVAPLTMGWCISCHKERQAPLDCLTCHR